LENEEGLSSFVNLAPYGKELPGNPFPIFRIQLRALGWKITSASNDEHQEKSEDDVGEIKMYSLLTNPV
jgi:hypothetical protein